LKKKLMLAILAAASIAAMTAGCGTTGENMSSLKNEVIKTPDLSLIPDGTYTGEYESGPVLARVSVDAAKHAIVSVKILKHRTMLGKPAEAIVDDVISKQSLDVDAVAGATLSSKVILKAIGIALKGNN
jgi:uncharacterized protein with FMN-binding domain